MRKVSIGLALLGLVGAGALLAGGAAAGPVKGEPGIAIAISPSTLSLGSDATCVTVHTNLPFGTVDAGSVALEGIAPYGVKADACGDFVAKFDIDAVKAIVAPPSATLTFTGSLNDGTPFAASDTIRVVKGR
jgi:hypothetical protein